MNASSVEWLFRARAETSSREELALAGIATPGPNPDMVLQ